MDDDTNVLLNAVGTGGARNSRWAIASFACGLVTLLGLLGGGFVPGVVYGFLFFAPAIATGHLALRQIGKHPGYYGNESMARYGLGMGYFGLFLSIFVVLAMLFVG